jgi:endoglycosylceramidase
MARPAALAGIVLLAAGAGVACGTKSADDPRSPPSADAGPPPPWRVQNGAIVDASGRTVILRGVNLAGAHKNKPYLSDFGPADYKRLRDEYGFTVLRFLVTWAAIEPQKGVYDERYLDEVQKRMGWARDAGLLVVVDMHQDLFGEGFAGGDGAPRWACDESRYAAFQPKDPWFFGYLDTNVVACVDGLYAEGGENRAHFVEAWRRLARRLANERAVLGFDALNEPHWGSYSILAFEQEKLAPFYVEVAKAVREIAPGWLFFAEPGSSRNVGYPTSLPKLPLDGVVYAPHSYDNDAESGKGFDAAHRDAVLQKLRDLRADADALGAALFVGEYGGNADAPGIVPYMDAEYTGIGAVAAGSAYWAFDKNDGGYALLKSDGGEKKVLADVLARAYPTRFAGTLKSYEVDASGTTIIRGSSSPPSAEPTEIVVPARAYPRGFDVDCGGCSVERAGDVVKLRGLPAEATIALRSR